MTKEPAPNAVEERDDEPDAEDAELLPDREAMSLISPEPVSGIPPIHDTIDPGLPTDSTA